MVLKTKLFLGMGSLAVFGGAGTGIYFLVDGKDGKGVRKDKVEPGLQTDTETTTPTTTKIPKEPATN